MNRAERHVLYRIAGRPPAFRHVASFYIWHARQFGVRETWRSVRYRWRHRHGLSVGRINLIRRYCDAWFPVWAPGAEWVES